MRSLATLSQRERDAVALALPAVAVALTYATWSLVSPSSWFFFYPAVFAAAWIGSVPAAAAATIVSAALCYYCFTYPRYTWIPGHPGDVWMAVLFLAMGAVFTFLFRRLRLQQARTVAAEGATLRAEVRERIARDLHDVVIQRMFAIGLQLKTLDVTAADPAIGERLSELCDQMDEVIETVRSTIFSLHPAEDDRAAA